MVSPWWGLGVAVPAVALRAFSGGKQKIDDEPLSRYAHSINNMLDTTADITNV